MSAAKHSDLACRSLGVFYCQTLRHQMGAPLGLGCYIGMRSHS